MRGFESTPLNESSMDVEAQRKGGFGWKLLGGIVMVALVVAVAGSTFSSDERVDATNFVSSPNPKLLDKRSVEESIFKSTGVRVEILGQEEFLASVRGSESSGVGSDFVNINTKGPFSIEFKEADRFLSSHNGLNKELVTENGVRGDDDKWEMLFHGSNYVYVLKKGTGNAIKIGDNQASLVLNVGVSSTTLVLGRVSSENPSGSYNANNFFLYEPNNNRKFLIWTGTKTDVKSTLSSAAFFKIENA